MWKVLLRYHHFPFLGPLSLRWIRKCTKNLCGAKTTSLSDISFLFYYRADQNLGHIESSQPVPFSVFVFVFSISCVFFSMIVKNKIEVTCVPADSLRWPTWVCWPVTTFLSFKFKLFNTKWSFHVHSGVACSSLVNPGCFEYTINLSWWSSSLPSVCIKQAGAKTAFHRGCSCGDIDGSPPSGEF